MKEEDEEEVMAGEGRIKSSDLSSLICHVCKYVFMFPVISNPASNNK